MRALGTTGNSGIAFTNMGEENDTALTNIGGRRDKSNITCFNRNEKGHYSNECTKPDRREGTQSGIQMLMSGPEQCEQAEFQFHQEERYKTIAQGIGTGYMYHQGEKLHRSGYCWTTN